MRFSDLFRKRRHIRTFQKQTTDYEHLVRKYYVDENGIAYISCNVKDYYDVIDRYSVKGYEWLNEEFVRFVEENANYIPPEYPILLDITGAYFTDEQKATIEKTIHMYYDLKLGDMQVEIRSSLHKMNLLVCLSVLGLTLLVLSYTLPVPRIIYEVATLFFWFFLWEAGDTLIYDHHDYVMQKTYVAQMKSMKVSFSSKFSDEPLDDETASAIMQEVFDDPID